jgi:HSP20 family protein
MDRTFERGFPSFFSGPGARAGLHPAVNVVETADTVEVTVELPGLTEKDIELKIQDNVLSVRGEKRSETEHRDEKDNLYICERQFGTFHRAISLPAHVESNRAKATFRNGVLTVQLPKVEAQKSRTIEIAAE